MRKIDRQTLEYLRNEGNRELVATPSVIAANIGFDRDYVRQRMRPLREADLVEYENEERGLYRLADRGRNYITGEMSNEEAEDLDGDLSSHSD